MSFEDKLYPLLNMYYNLPQPLSQIVGVAYRNLPMSFRKGAEYKRFFSLAASQDDPDLINKDFIRTIDVAKKIPFYQRLYSDHGVCLSAIQDVSDISKLPTISKKDIKENFELFVNPSVKGRGLYLTTGGSTGTPVGFYLEKGVTRAKESAFIDYLWSDFGYSEKSKTAIIRGLTIKSKDGIARFDSVKNSLLLSSSMLTTDTVSYYVDCLNKFKPDFIQAYPSAIYLLSRLMVDKNLTLNFVPKAIFCGSENIYEEHKNLIEKVFLSKIFSWYGHTERVLLARSTKNTGYKFMSSYGISELLDSNGDNVFHGVGELCGTSLHNSVMPLIRYRTEDLASIDDGFTRKCVTDPLYVKSIDGRAHEFVYSSSNRPVSMTLINMHSDVFDKLERFQFVQEEYGEVLFTYTSAKELSGSDISRILSEVGIKLGDGFRLNLERVDQISLSKNGKQTFLKQNLKLV